MKSKLMPCGDMVETLKTVLAAVNVLTLCFSIQQQNLPELHKSYISCHYRTTNCNIQVKQEGGSWAVHIVNFFFFRGSGSCKFFFFSIKFKCSGEIIQKA
jgi:hypothetical protein